GWDGEETSGFTGEKGNEYMLVFKKHDEAGENIKGVVSVFLLPPLRDSPAEIAGKLASMQENSTTPCQEGNFWTFSGEPRTQGFKAPAVTRVNATPKHVLIIIVQDPEHLGGDKLFASLKGLTPESREALGR
ncbi:MAG: protoporphyrinogen oxidase, partial [Desulfovibrio sp.]|nr:protoporphyrinogen oxidase [Desulfovibrio sp.]